ncbi:MAG: anaerobic ribonucleoside-triphosphate reductase activating protein [Tenericutes bacterium]|nr:anaerobic ribonucleoside-triphosphate reductase activating protein [Mycoplasmatota bacterium]
MKYAQIREMDVTNGNGIGVALFTQGCPYHCKNCFNPETWDFNKGTDWTKETENRIIELLKPEYITRLTILGGEPLIERNIEPLTALLKRVKSVYPDKQVWLYTGGDFEVLEGLYEEIFQYIDILIDGRYIDDLRDYKLKWRGSSNQRIIDVQASLKSGNVTFSPENTV